MPWADDATQTQCGAPVDVIVCWFINPRNTIVISTKKHSEIGVMFTNLAIKQGPHIVGWMVDGDGDDANSKSKHLGCFRAVPESHGSGLTPFPMLKKNILQKKRRFLGTKNVVFVLQFETKSHCNPSVSLRGKVSPILLVPEGL